MDLFISSRLATGQWDIGSRERKEASWGRKPRYDFWVLFFLFTLLLTFDVWITSVQFMEEREGSGGHKKCSSRARSSCNRARNGSTTHCSHTFMQFQNPYQRYPQGILPLPPILPLQQLVVTPPILQSHGLMTQALQKTSFKKTNSRAASSDTPMPVFQLPKGMYWFSLCVVSNIFANVDIFLRMFCLLGRCAVVRACQSLACVY